MSQQLITSLLPFLILLITIVIVGSIIFYIGYRKGYRLFCPNCGMGQNSGWSHQCPRCGVVFKEWKN